MKTVFISQYARVTDSEITLTLTAQLRTLTALHEAQHEADTQPVFVRSVDLVSAQVCTTIRTDNEPLASALCDAFSVDYVRADTLAMMREYMQGASGQLAEHALYGQCVFYADNDAFDDLL